MSIQLISLVTAVLVNITLGIVGVYRKPRLQTWLFLLLLLSVNGWLAATYFLLQTSQHEQVTFWMGWIFAFVTIQNMAYALFVLVQTGAKMRSALTWGYVFFSLGVVVLALAGQVLARHPGGDMPGVGMPSFLFHVVGSVGIGFARILRRRPRVTGYMRSQLDYLFFASLVLFTVVPFANFVLPVAFGVRELLVFSPFFSIIASGLIVYAMLRHHLFDIRTFIVRAVVYVGLLAVLVVFYVLIVLDLGTRLLVENSLGEYVQGFYVFVTLLTAVSYTPMRKYFAHITNRIFFQDAYATRNVVSRLNALLVRTTAVGKVTHDSLVILSEAIKPQFAGIISMPKDAPERHWLVSSGRRRLQLDQLTAELAANAQTLVVLDDIEDHTKKHIHKLMDNLNIGLLIRLETSSELIGYMFFGYKVNGSMYSRQDVELAKIAANELAIAIQNALRFEEISHFNETLQQQVREATTELRAGNKKLKSLDQAKDEFISMASHQLRTPLTSVKGYVSMVLEGDAGKLNPTQHQLLEQAFASSQRMVYLISDFLNVSRLQTGKFTIERTAVNLAEVVLEEVKQLRSTAESRDLKIEVNVPSNFPILSLDESKLRQAIMNFIDNAIFYSRPGGVIKVDLIKSGKDLTLTIQDQGIGVPPAERHHLFTKFYRATNARTARPDGTGIGLFMAKKVVVAHGGSIVFNSVEGKGSTFGFRLPLASSLPKQESE